MCLAMPAQIIKLKDSQYAIVNLGGVEKQISIELIDNPKVGDYVIMHVGYALTKLNELEAKKTLSLFDELDELTT